MPTTRKTSAPSKIGRDTEARVQAQLGQGARLAGATQPRTGLGGASQPRTGPAGASQTQEPPATPRNPRGSRRTASKGAPPVLTGLDPEGIRAALREAAHRPEHGNVKTTVDLPRELREQLADYCAWHGFTYRSLLSLLIGQTLAADPDGGWRS